MGAHVNSKSQIVMKEETNQRSDHLVSETQENIYPLKVGKSSERRPADYREESGKKG